jgi:DNA repair protein RadA/Sms
MAGPRTRFVCTSCGGESLRWEGRCPACGEWNTLREAPAVGAGSIGRTRAGPGHPGRPPAPLADADGGGEDRLELGVGELDRVLGGGVVPGSLVLLGGAPGIGKSTLLLQVAASLQARDVRCLYVSGEESARQVAMRAERLGGRAGNVSFLAETDVESIVAAASEIEPALLCIDSIQKLRSSRLDAASGGITQVRESAAVLQAFAKETGTATFLVGHVTKQGGLAGPRALEHLVDAVLLFEGQRTLEHRLLRSIKNRFGGTDEMAVFRMTGSGLETVADPSGLFLADRPEGVSGSAVAVPLQGSRPLLAEVQALTAPGRFGTPQRVVTGLPPRRLSLLLAVLGRRGGPALGDADVFVNVVGGLRLTDPATDLAVMAALVSASWAKWGWPGRSAVW